MAHPLDSHPTPRLASGLSAGLLALPPRGLPPRAPFQDIITDGSTEGIVIAGVIILLIILVPIAWTRSRWNR